MEQTPEEHVVLNFFSLGKQGICPVGGEGGTLGFYRVFPDSSTKEFAIPKGRLLVVTDFNVTAYVSSPFVASESVTTSLRLGEIGKVGGTIVYRSSFHLTDALVSRNFTTGESMHSGVVVAANTALCPLMELDDGSQAGLSLTITGGNYRGYLIDESAP